MNRVLMAALAISLVAGCSTIQTAATSGDNVDHQYIAAVEQAAKRYGTTVVWVNLPQKRTAPATTQ